MPPNDIFGIEIFLVNRNGQIVRPFVDIRNDYLSLRTPEEEHFIDGFSLEEIRRAENRMANEGYIFQGFRYDPDSLLGPRELFIGYDAHGNMLGLTRRSTYGPRGPHGRSFTASR